MLGHPWFLGVLLNNLEDGAKTWRRPVPSLMALVIPGHMGATVSLSPSLLGTSFLQTLWVPISSDIVSLNPYNPKVGSLRATSCAGMGSYIF